MPFDQELLSLPHGGAFRFIDEVRELDPGRSGVGVYRIRGDEVFLEGHFPGNPIWPGVIMIEAIAQLGGVIAQCDPEYEVLADMRLTSVKNAKILGTAVPGAVLRISGRVEGRMGGLIQVRGEVCDGERVIAQAVVMLSGG